MSVFHVPPVCANANARAVGALERLREHVDVFRTDSLAGEDFERVERELHERFVEAEREVLGQLLERLDVDVPSVEIGGRQYHRVLRSTETYTKAVGTVTAKRTLYRCGRERAVVPMELRAGIVEGYWTALAARQASCVVAQMTPSEGEALLREFGNMAPSKSSLDRLPKALSARWVELIRFRGHPDTVQRRCSQWQRHMVLSPSSATRRQNACNVLIFRSRKPKVGTTRHRAGERGRGAQTQIRGGGWAGKFSLSC